MSGGADSGSAVTVSSLNTWYTTTFGSDENQWYSLSVNPSEKYDLFWDDGFNSSNTYDCDVMVTVYKSDGVTEYNSQDSGYRTALVITLTESSILIKIKPFGFDTGSVAFGLLQE